MKRPSTLRGMFTRVNVRSFSASLCNVTSGKGPHPMQRKAGVFLPVKKNGESAAYQSSNVSARLHLMCCLAKAAVLKALTQLLSGILLRRYLR